jgi:hypothetical protein
MKKFGSVWFIKWFFIGNPNLDTVVNWLIVFSQFSKPVLFLFFNPYGRLISKEIENEFWRIGSDFLHDILAHRKSKDYFSGNEFLLDFVQKVKTFFFLFWRKTKMFRLSCVSKGWVDLENRIASRWKHGGHALSVISLFLKWKPSWF